MAKQGKDVQILTTEEQKRRNCIPRGTAGEKSTVDMLQLTKLNPKNDIKIKIQYFILKYKSEMKSCIFEKNK